MSREILQPKGLFDSGPLGFSQVVTSPPGTHVFVSGQVAMDEKMQLVGGDDLAAQAQQAVRNLTLALEGAGASLDDLTHVRVFVVGYGRGSMRALGPALAGLQGSDGHAAQTLIGVAALATPELLIEIEATAIVGA